MRKRIISSTRKRSTLFTSQEVIDALTETFPERFEDVPAGTVLQYHAGIAGGAGYIRVEW